MRFIAAFRVNYDIIARSMPLLMPRLFRDIYITLTTRIDFFYEDDCFSKKNTTPRMRALATRAYAQVSREL